MITKDNIDLFVRQEDSRPAGNPGECFYCQNKIGAAHSWECVIPQKMVILKSVFTYATSVPRSWTKDDIEFHRNQSSSCADNVLNDIMEAGEADGCLCDGHHTEFLGDVK